MWNIFEQPWTLLAGAVIATITIWIIRAVKPQKCCPKQWLLPLLIAAAAFGIDFLVKTNPEQIRALIATSARAIQQENAETIDNIIAKNYHDSVHLNKNLLMIHCRARFSKPLVEKAIPRIVSIDIAPDKTTAEAIFTIRLLFDKQSLIFQNYKRTMTAKVSFDLQKPPSSPWLINRVDLLDIDRLPASWTDIK